MNPFLIPAITARSWLIKMRLLVSEGVGGGGKSYGLQWT
uniref:Uncharacterized protein n=1 Tax=Anguilla anguilla TaxID=7936 RepID=A0A0E9SBG0_ANGAN